MKNKGIIIVLLFFVLASDFFSCCRQPDIETDRFEFTHEDSAMIPYHLGDTIPFIDPGGDMFNFTVVEDRVQWKEFRNTCEFNCCGQEYFSYQWRNTILTSENPKFNIEISTFSNNPPFLIGQLGFLINDESFSNILYDTTNIIICDPANAWMNCYDSIQINNAVYYQVIETYFINPNNPIDSLPIRPLSFLFNKSEGLLRLNMTNNENYSINK